MHCFIPKKEFKTAFECLPLQQQERLVQPSRFNTLLLLLKTWLDLCSPLSPKSIFYSFDLLKCNTGKWTITNKYRPLILQQHHSRNVRRDQGGDDSTVFDERGSSPHFSSFLAYQSRHFFLRHSFPTKKDFSVVGLPIQNTFDLLNPTPPAAPEQTGHLSGTRKRDCANQTLLEEKERLLIGGKKNHPFIIFVPSPFFIAHTISPAGKWRTLCVSIFW